MGLCQPEVRIKLQKKKKQQTTYCISRKQQTELRDYENDKDQRINSNRYEQRKILCILNIKRERELTFPADLSKILVLGTIR